MWLHSLEFKKLALGMGLVKIYVELCRAHFNKCDIEDMLRRNCLEQRLQKVSSVKSSEPVVA